jgi:uncharacterized protein YcbX
MLARAPARRLKGGGGMGAAFVSEISIFPVKSLRGATHQAARVEPCGLAGDRRWMVVDQAGRFMSQRDDPVMALVQASLDGVALILSGAQGALRVSPPEGSPVRVQIWQDGVNAQDAGADAAAWLTETLGTPCRLVHLADPAARKLAAAHAATGSESVSLADGFPLLLANTASLDAVNARLAAPVPMLRFRPNLVVSGAAPWAEDTWRRIRIGNVVLRVAKPCERCIMTTIDPQTGTRPHGNDPLKTMAHFRRDTNGRILFGQNLVPETTGEIRLGDAVEILQAGASNAALPSPADAGAAARAPGQTIP